MVKDQRFLREDSFIDRIEVEKKDADKTPCNIPIEVVAQKVSRAIGVPQDWLYSLTRGREGAYGRSIVAYLTRTLTGHKVIELAQHFQRSPMLVQRCLSQKGLKSLGSLAIRKEKCKRAPSRTRLNNIYASGRSNQSIDPGSRRWSFPQEILTRRK